MTTPEKRRGFFKRALGLLIEAEYIGQPECPLMVRWTVAAPFKGRFGKITIHYFPPEASDPDPHDHPAPFVTFILRGRYLDTAWVRYCGQTVPTQQLVEAGQIRYRRAGHTHTTTTGRHGAWTLVVMGPKIREWGFIRPSEGHTWWHWKKYVKHFPGEMRCEPMPLLEPREEAVRSYKSTPPPYDLLG